MKLGENGENEHQELGDVRNLKHQQIGDSIDFQRGKVVG